jgi:hypothetical protein
MFTHYNSGLLDFRHMQYDDDSYRIHCRIYISEPIHIAPVYFRKRVEGCIFERIKLYFCSNTEKLHVWLIEGNFNLSIPPTSLVNFINQRIRIDYDYMEYIIHRYSIPTQHQHHSNIYCPVSTHI